MKRSLQPAELPEDDGQADLRAKVREIHTKYSSHEQRASALRELMTSIKAKPKKSKPAVDEMTGSNAAWMAKHSRPNDMPVAPQLEELPTELVQNIASYFELREFSAFRIAGRKLMQKSQHTFLKTFFKSRTVKLEWEPLRRFYVILTHSDGIFASAVKELLVLDIPVGLGKGQRNAIELGGPTFDSGGAAARPRRGLRMNSGGGGWNQQQAAAARQTQSVQMMLDKVMEKMVALEKVEVRGDPGGKGPFEEVLDPCFVAMVLGSMIGNRIKPKELSIGGKAMFDAAPSIANDNNDRYLKTMKEDLDISTLALNRSFSTITRFELLWWPDPTFDPEKTHAQRFPNTFLALMPNLEILVSRLRNPPGFRQSNWPLAHLDWLCTPLPKLKEAHFHGHGQKNWNLLDAVKSFTRWVHAAGLIGGSLRMLELYGIPGTNPSPERDQEINQFLAAVRKEVTIEKMKLGQVYSGNDD